MRKGLITTNDQKPTGPVEPKKLGVITTNAPDKEAEEKGRAKGVIPFATPKPEGWQPKGTDLSKMITTHDIDDEVMQRAKRETNRFEEDFPIDLGVDNHAEVDSGEKVISHKKAGRPKKAE